MKPQLFLESYSLHESDRVAMHPKQKPKPKPIDPKLGPARSILPTMRCKRPFSRPCGLSIHREREFTTSAAAYSERLGFRENACRLGLGEECSRRQNDVKPLALGGAASPWRFPCHSARCPLPLVDALPCHHSSLSRTTYHTTVCVLRESQPMRISTF
jgi:hypothetical protein